jgi:hypothetical protein
LDQGGSFLPAVSLARGGPRALAAFVKRPQAACSNRRYIYFLETGIEPVNENYLSDFRCIDSNYFHLTPQPENGEVCRAGLLCR